MKLNLSAKEILALHNVLHERCALGLQPLTEPADADNVQLRQVYNRLRALMIGALSNKVVDPVDSWMQHEQAKINELNRQNDELKEVARDPDFFAPKSTDVDDYEKYALEYPRRSAVPSMPRPGKHRGKR